MLLTRYETEQGARWAKDGYLLPVGMDLSALLGMPRTAMVDILNKPLNETANGTLLAPVDPMHEVWAAGVTYLRSREARRVESAVADVYERVYQAPRPELFFKAIGWRVGGDAMPIRIRSDSRWNVPETELVLVINSSREIVGFTAGNDMSSRDIEGENPLYLPQAKIYNGACALGPGIVPCEPQALDDLRIRLVIRREGATIFEDETSTARIKRPFSELVAYLMRELAFPDGVLLMTGTGIVPPNEFTLCAGDAIEITVGELTLRNRVEN